MGGDYRMKPFICEHTCEYCVADGCEERCNLPMGTHANTFPIQDCDNVNVVVKGNGIPVIGVNKIFYNNLIIDRIL